MKKVFLAAFSLSLLFAGCGNNNGGTDETLPDALYGNDMEAAAYIDYRDDNTIYLYDGDAVAYIVSQEIFTFGGMFLGWYVDGVVYDKDDYHAVGAKRDIVRFGIDTSAPMAEPVKSDKKAKPEKLEREQVPPREVLLIDQWGETAALAEFFSVK